MDTKSGKKLPRPIGTVRASNAVRKGQYVPYFQPIVEIRTGQLAGFEVLARWEHPDLGLVSPDRFIFLAERYGWIADLTRALLRGAFEAACAIPDPLKLSVNISPVLMRDPGLPGLIQDAAQGTGFAFDRLIVEVTESALLGDLDGALQVACALKAMGCMISLDDFGTGYSSLLHLQSLPFDELKVDRSFVSSMTEERQSRKIVAAVVGLGQSLGLRTVAEGIETGEDAEMALWLGCEFGQGWYYGKPVPAKQLPAVLQAERRKLFGNASGALRGSPAVHLEGLPAQRLSQLQAIYDGAPVGLAFVDRNLRYVNLNRKLADMNGLPIEEHIGRTVAEIVPTLFPAVEPYLRRALAGEAILELELRLPASREVRLISYQPARDEAGEVVGLSIACMRIAKTSRNPVPAEIEGEAAALPSLGGMDWSGLRDVFATMSNGVTICDARRSDLPLSYINPAFERMTGYGLADVFGRNCRFLHNADPNQPELDEVRAAIAEQRSTRVVLKNFRKDGTSFWNELYLSPIRNQNGETTHYLGIQNDISERIELEEKVALLVKRDSLIAMPHGSLLM